MVGAIAWWISTSYRPDSRAMAALASTESVRYELSERGWITFKPAGMPVLKGLILYPGGKVDPRAYSSIGRSIAAAGFLVVIVPMPLNLAVFDPDAGREVVRAYPAVDVWAIGGHSLGGAMAAQAAAGTGLFRGLVLMAAYANPPIDFSQRSSLSCLSLTGTEDTVLSTKKYLANMKLLPPRTNHQSITGGNHSQFGAYGVQEGDGKALVSPESQEATVVKLITAFMESL